MIPLKLSLLYPTILVHGIGGDSSDLIDLKNGLESEGAEVYNMEIGNGKIDSIIWNINKQCQVLGENINNLSLESDKINLIGVSQGGLLARCYVEKYANSIKPVHSLITYGAPHMGIYISWIDLSKLEYWKNPFKYQEYLDNNDFLAYINNDRKHTDMKLYRDNLVSLDNFLVIWTDLEKVVDPKESTRFEFYNISMAETSGDLEIVNFQESEIYIEDIIGLRELDKNGKLKVKQYDCQHEEFKHSKCFLKNFTNQQYSLLDLTISLL
jgi:pimeloyl-ACP methyl ester carboxylesterase